MRHASVRVIRNSAWPRSNALDNVAAAAAKSFGFTLARTSTATPLPLTPATTPTALMATSAAEVAGSDPVSDAADPPGYVGLVEEIASPIS